MDADRPSEEASSTPADVARVAVEWAAAEGWNPGLDDAERFAAADPDAFLAATRAGEIVGTVSCALYGDDYGFLGFYIVRPDLRGGGIGTPLFDSALARAGRRVVGLDGVLAQQPSYEKRGFVLSHRNVRWRTVGGGLPADGLVELSSLGFDDVAAYDATVFGCRRDRFLRTWIDRPGSQALASVTGGVLRGYGVVRPCRAGFKVGPLFADDDSVAQDVLTGLLAATGPASDVFVDMPAGNPGTARLRASREMTPSFETARMYLNGRPPEDIQRSFGVTTLEFG